MMLHRIFYLRVAVLPVVLFALQACTVPTQRKADVRTAHTGQSFTKHKNYIALARFWDDNATKQTIDFKGASFLSVIPEEGRAEITIGNGPYYGLIDLRKITDQSTRVTVFAWVAWQTEFTSGAN